MDKQGKKTFGVLFFSIFSAVTGVGIVVPLLPVYAHHLGAGGISIGLIFGSFSISRTFLLPFFGKLSDAKGRKPFIVVGLLCYTLISFAFIASNDVISLIIIRFVQGMASAMIMPVTQAYVGDITPKGKEGFYMGLFNLSMFISLSLGPVMGGVLNDHLGLDIPFVCMGGLSFIGFFLAIYFLPKVKNEPTAAQRSRSVGWTVLWKDPIVAGLFSIRLVYVTCIGIIWSFLPVFADTEFHLSASQIGILVMIPVFVSGLLQMPAGYIADRVNKSSMIFWGGSIIIVTVFSIYWAHGFWGLFVTNIFFGIGGGIVMPPVMAWTVIKGNETKSMGSIMGLLTMGHSIGMLLGSFFAGVTMEMYDLRLAFPLGALLMFLGLVFFYICTRNKKTQEHMR